MPTFACCMSSSSSTTPTSRQQHRRHLDELMVGTDEARRTVMENDAEARTGVEITSHLVRGIAPGETIVESAENLGCDLIVMGTHGRRGLSHLLLGSVAERVVRTSAVPVLTVRSDAAINPEGIRRILVPHDFSEASATADPACNRVGAGTRRRNHPAPRCGTGGLSRILLGRCAARRPHGASDDSIGGSPRKTAAGELGRYRPDPHRGRGRAGGRHHHVVRRSGDFDLVVMATRGLSGLEHVLLGSVAESVLRRCRVPMLTIPG